MLDTNILVSAILFGGIPRELLREALRGAFEIVTSRELLQELEDLLPRRFGVPAAIAHAARQELEGIAVVVAPAEVSHRSRDPDDDRVLACSEAGDAAYVVTGDRDLLVLRRHGRAQIVTARDLQELLVSST